ncbi:uncharacterized protein LOC135200724 [Macrobrachium nipponense]|uniref:uncharacterized protein LOC135200724 n=1 Tax=Macrobrachium nipponense TaxID=159736 RepID=UPI0030C7AB85
MATLDYHLSSSGSPFKNLIAISFYVDNLQGSMSNEIELLEFYAEANKQLRSANMPLRTWVTDNERLKTKIEEDNSGYDVPTTTSVLGLNWDIISDMLSLKSAKMFVPEVITKRNLLSLVSTVFDPLGFLCRVIIRGKILIQAAWRTNVSWNDPLGEEFSSSWTELYEEFKALSKFSVPRKVATQGVNYVLHIFCDSSTKAYGCAAYLVGNGEKLLIWSDNEAAIQWVRNDNCKMTYVKNRVAEIREVSANYQIFHVSTGENPADLVTRGVEVKDLVSNSLWFKGPSWLPCEGLWPSEKDEVVVYEITAEGQIDPVKVECLFEKPHSLSVECSDLIKDLGQYFDPSIGLMRSRGRLQHAGSAVNSKYPVLVPPGEHLTNFFILKAHRPFENVGVDYSGPIVITKTEDNEPRKVYICLFTCTATRAVHLDVALDMTAESFLLIFRRFCGTWSVPKQIISDNGTNFKATAKFLEELCSDPQIREYFSNRGIVWKFVAPRAPWQGGFYERMIKVVKNCLQKVLYHKIVSLDELQTVVVEIQSRVNNRPLTYINSDRMSPESLSPSHLLYGRSIEAMPPFEKILKNEYIISLREPHYVSDRARELNNLKVGDVVLVQVESPRSEWPLGRIVELRPDSEGVIRSVDVYCKGHVGTRTVEKLVPLEVSEPVNEELIGNLDDNVNTDVPSYEMPHPPGQMFETHPQRASKTRATLERGERS